MSPPISILFPALKGAPMRLSLKLFLPLLAASMTLAACGSSSNSSNSSSQAGTTAASSSQAGTAPSSGEGASGGVKTASNATLHTTVLVNAQGMTLYHLSGEAAGKFICTSSACLQVWHPVPASSATSSGGVSSLGTVKRPDGTAQLTYNGAPVYTFAPDKNAGEVGGQGVRDVGTWTAVTTSAAGTAPSTSSQPAPAAPASSGGSYGY
jgi:predicted lipoprotein with Yx(FWY)xxD motif